MNISEAIAVNMALRYFLGIDNPNTRRPVTSEDGLRNASLLAARANNALSAGIRPGDVVEAWPKVAAGAGWRVAARKRAGK
jgi:hypothetical protein